MSEKSDLAKEMALNESFTAEPQTSAHLSHKPDHWSSEAKARRETLIARLNASWSEASERALSAIAERFPRKS
jgi:hypothetical protein